MTCSQCRHEFCWLCHGAWADHGERTGGFYNCNRFKKAVERGEVDEEEQKRQHARQSLERYMHYWQRWAENDSSRKKALQQVERFRSELAEPLSERTATPTSQLKFVTDAWMQARAPPAAALVLLLCVEWDVGCVCVVMCVVQSVDG